MVISTSIKFLIGGMNFARRKDIEKRFMTNKNVPYKLMIVTDSYTGNFERELISFCLGLDEKTAFARPFWDKTVGTGIENIEKYKEFVNKQDNIKMEDDELYYFIIDIKKRLHNNANESLSDEEFKAKCKKSYINIKNKNKEKRWTNFYDKYLCYTNQDVDDIKEDTFYNICSYDNSDNKYNALYIQLNDIIPKYFEHYIISYIFEFFRENVYKKIYEYIWLCYGWYDYKDSNDMKLLKLLLLDENDNIIKEYKQEEYI